MLTRLQAGPYTICGVSVGGVYTSISVPELDALFDIGIAPRSFVGLDHLFLSHGHADHMGALAGLLGVRGLSRKGAPRTFLPVQIADEIRVAIEALGRIQRYEPTVDWVPVSPGDEYHLHSDLYVRVFPTFHPVPSVGYQLFRRVEKLKPEFLGLPGAEIGRRKQAGEPLFVTVDRDEVAYATDTTIEVVDREPALYKSRVLILECTFLDDRKDVAESRTRGHIHLDEVIKRADRFENEHLVLMHFSQVYSPAEVRQILEQRCPAHLWDRLSIFAPAKGHWPG